MWGAWAITIMLMGTGAAHAEPPPAAPVVVEIVPDLEAGRRVFEVCARCHLPEAWGDADGSYPQLAGQHPRVLMRQLLDIRSGRRRSPLMYPFVQERVIGGFQALADVVAYIATLPMTPEPTRGPFAAETPEHRQGAELYRTRCAACHGSAGEGNDGAAQPRLQGQHYPYMLRQVRKVRKGLRKVAPEMAAAVEALDDAQLRTVISYVSHLPVPQDDLAPSATWRNPDFE